MSDRGFEFHVCTLPPRDAGRMRELADAAYSAGFDRFWVSDQTFHVDPFVMLNDLAPHTPIALGLAVTNPFVRHPAQLARAMATLAHLHPDRRWIFGLGTANPQNVLAPLGVQMVRGPANVGAAIDAIRSLVAGETVSLDDPRLAFSLHGVRLEIDPPPPFDIYIGTRGPRMLEMAGAVADGAIVEAQFTPRGIAWARERLDAGSRTSNRGSFDRPYVAWQTVELLRDGGQLSAHSVEFAAVLIAATPDDTLRAMDVPIELAERLRARKIAPGEVPRGAVTKFVAAGTARELIELVTQAETAGVDAWAAVFAGDVDHALEAMRNFGSHVIAAVRRREPLGA